MENTPPKPQRPYIGTHLLIIKDTNILLMKQSRTTKSIGGHYTLVAGKVDQFESPSDAMIREAHEEIGITIKKEDLKLVSIFHRAATCYKGQKEDVIELIYTTQQWSGDIINKEPEKCDEVSFFSLDARLPSPCTDSVSRAIKCYQQNIHYIEV